MINWSVRKEFLMHLVSTVLLMLVLVLTKYLSLTNLIPLFVLGSLVGMVLPDIDHLIYAFYLHPNDLSSERIKSKLSQKRLMDVFSLLYVTREERNDLVFHNALFQSFFVVFSFLVVSSTSSPFGKGLVLSFLLHLLMDQYRNMRFLEMGSSWFIKIPKEFFPSKRQSEYYIIVQALALLALVFIF